ncbi:MAG: MBL fold metallo-hydrolase [Anaerolineae bacterium]
MQLTFLGTGASEGFPCPFCRCEHCEEARRRGGRNLRLRSSLLVNDDLLIDLNDIIASCGQHGLTLDAVQTLLITHRHGDHLYPELLEYRAYPFTTTPLPEMAIYGPYDAIAAIAEHEVRPQEVTRLHTQVVQPGSSWHNGAYDFRAFHASHGTADPLIYAIDDGTCRILYATDSGRYTAETWSQLCEQSYDAVIMDETMGTADHYESHLGIDSVLHYRALFAEQDLLRPGARFIAHHFSHGANPAYEELVEIFAPHGIEVAYDGWRLEV